MRFSKKHLSSDPLTVVDDIISDAKSFSQGDNHRIDDLTRSSLVVVGDADPELSESPKFVCAILLLLYANTSLLRYLATTNLPIFILKCAILTQTGMIIRPGCQNCTVVGSIFWPINNTSGGYYMKWTKNLWGSARN